MKEELFKNLKKKKPKDGSDVIVLSSSCGIFLGQYKNKKFVQGGFTYELENPIWAYKEDFINKYYKECQI